jgi:hypothetical protein
MTATLAFLPILLLPSTLRFDLAGIISPYPRQEHGDAR